MLGKILFQEEIFFFMRLRIVILMKTLDIFFEKPTIESLWASIKYYISEEVNECSLAGVLAPYRKAMYLSTMPLTWH